VPATGVGIASGHRRMVLSPQRRMLPLDNGQNPNLKQSRPEKDPRL
jgi:hypothetical protein